jgi:hypothetical protein
MTYPKRGLAIVISNRCFEASTGMSERTGTEIDAIALQSRFQELGFEVRVYKDLAVNQMLTLMKQGRLFFMMTFVRVIKHIKDCGIYAIASCNKKCQ